MGTELRARGAVVPDYRISAWAAMAPVHDPDTVRQVHADYITAGADVITTNSYAVVPKLLDRAGRADRLEELTRSACRLSCAARAMSDCPEVRVAGSLLLLDTSYEPELGCSCSSRGTGAFGAGLRGRQRTLGPGRGHMDWRLP